ncbi:hypothetical protein BJP37_18725 [Moorena bouillonii PNG]|uniref:Uncharacterized protein n=1 Tax=Moorena bouillonii PNG TaxID=568701 RepID=A0A1U7N494_9CYAN|nr:hypothetical protein BJP37_18725 [Moorena bouillonii PNG]
MFFLDEIRCIIISRLVISHKFSTPQHPYQSSIALRMQRCLGGKHRENSGADTGFTNRTGRHWHLIRAGHRKKQTERKPIEWDGPND